MYKTGEFAKMLKVCTKTLQRWDKLGILVPDHRSQGGRRYYSHKQYLKYFNLNIKKKTKIVAYCRVSSNNQKKRFKNPRTIFNRFCFQ